MSVAEEWSKRSGRHQFIQKGQDGVVEYYLLNGREVTREEYYAHTKVKATEAKKEWWRNAQDPKEPLRKKKSNASTKEEWVRKMCWGNTPNPEDIIPPVICDSEAIESTKPVEVECGRCSKNADFDSPCWSCGYNN